MNSWVILFTLCVLGLSGCSNHYYKVTGNSILFYLKNKTAKTVEFCYSVDDFSCHPVRKATDDTWEIRVPVHEEFSYFYLVDGKAYAPSCSLREKDDFGHENCLFIHEM